MTCFYVWKDIQLFVYEEGEFGIHQDSLVPFYNCPMVDTRYDTPELRYGTINVEGWLAMPLEDFPPPFRAQLLLLGIPL